MTCKQQAVLRAWRYASRLHHDAWTAKSLEGMHAAWPVLVRACRLMVRHGLMHRDTLAMMEAHLATIRRHHPV